jgi:hypothetical protein
MPARRRAACVCDAGGGTGIYVRTDLVRCEAAGSRERAMADTRCPICALQIAWVFADQ